MINTFKILSFIIIFVSCGRQDPRLPISVKSGVDYSASIELSKKINQREEIQFRKYKEKQNQKFEKSNFGFQYYVDNNNDSLIKSSDIVQYSLVVENLRGEVIYPKVNKQLVVDRQTDIKGMHEGLKLMSIGANAIFLFPSHQAFGFHGDDNKIKSNTPLVYKVKVTKVNNNQISNK